MAGAERIFFLLIPLLVLLLSNGGESQFFFKTETNFQKHWPNCPAFYKLYKHF